LLVKGYKTGAGDAAGKEGGGGRSFEKSDHLSVEAPVRKAFPAFAGTSFECISGRPLLHRTKAVTVWRVQPVVTKHL